MTESPVKEHPILFSTPMVQAILDGRKTVTRRIVKGEFKSISQPYEGNGKTWVMDDNGNAIKCPYGNFGDVLWVRETWLKLHPASPEGYIDFNTENYYYAADGDTGISKIDADGFHLDNQNDKWKPSIHMPRIACRIRLRITCISIESLNSISEEDAKSEGVEGLYPLITAVEEFENLWCRINGSDSWNSNPWVWVIKFERI